MDYISSYNSPVGTLTLLSNGESLCGLWIAGQKHFGTAIKANALQKDDLPIFASVSSWLDDYFSKLKPSVSALHLDPSGSEFRRNVWDILLEIGYGETVTYGDIAHRLEAKRGLNTSARAVGGAVAHNPISIIIPCHRVVGALGNLTGYAGGIDRKIKLLELEGVDTSRFSAPK